MSIVYILTLIEYLLNTIYTHRVFAKLEEATVSIYSTLLR